MIRQKALFGKLTCFMCRKSTISADLPGSLRAYYPGRGPGRINFCKACELITAERGLIAAERELIASGECSKATAKRDVNIPYAYVNMLIGIFDSQIGIFVH